MSTPEDEFLKSLRETFATEADEHLQTISSGLLGLEKSPSADEQRLLIEEIFRAAHSLKGAARAVNFTDIELICQSLENTFATWKQRGHVASPQVFDTVHRTLDSVTRLIGGNSPGSAAPPPSPPSQPSSPPAFPPEVVPGVSFAVPAPTPSAPPARDKPTVLERTPGGDTVRISVAKLDSRLLEAEELLTAKMTTGQHATDLRELSGQLKKWAKEWSAIQPEIHALRQTLERANGQSTLPSAVRRLIEFCDWNHDYFRTLEAGITTLHKTADQDRATVGKLVDDLLEDTKKLLMLPLATQSALYHKVVRDLCRDQGKEAELMTHGEEVELDKRILEEMKDPLIHLLRNCVDHGIEMPAERQRRGKPARATITLSVSNVNGSKVELVIADDGAGIDVAKVRQAAIKRGLTSPAEADSLSDADARALIFKSDISTSPIITQISGRGLGLAIVREKTEKLGGRVTVESVPGQGTTFRITLPVALATFRGILVEAAGRVLVVPIAGVERVARFRPDEVLTVEGRETLSIGDRAVSLLRLAEVLEIPPEEHIREAPASLPVLLLGSGDQRVAFAVDAVLDEHEVLVKQFGKPLSRVRNISGATILGTGRVAPILNVSDLLKSARRPGRGARPASSGKQSDKDSAKSILIAEDSITSRMLLKGILEGAGYQVKTAVDGMEAFTFLRAEHFDLVVSDVEMPRLNGFDLTARIRADRKLAETPVILVTALESREDRERGVDAGANAYLVKSSFDQSNLLEAVRRLA